MAAQPPQSGSLEQVLRCLRLLALSPAFTTEMSNVANYVGPGAFTPGPFRDAVGATFTLDLEDTAYTGPENWIPTAWRRVYTTQQMRPVPPYPQLSLLGSAGRMQRGDAAALAIVDTGEAAGWVYTVDAVAVASADRPDIAPRRAMAMMQAFEFLVRRNEHLGGLVQLIQAESPPAPGGEIEVRKIGLISGVMQRFSVYVEAIRP